MPTKTDKRTSNLFIAGGYCLVAIIILFNYLGQSESKGRVKTNEVAPAISSTILPGPITDTQKQLEEEKRVNQEMREMIRRLQGGIGDRSDAIEAPISESSTQNPFAIPEISRSLIDSIGEHRSNPFIPGKNPFAAARYFEDSTGDSGPEGESAQALQCDPRLPFIISGANSKSNYFANF